MKNKKFNKDDIISYIIMIIVLIMCLIYIFINTSSKPAIKKNDYNTYSSEIMYKVNVNRQIINDLIELCENTDNDIEVAELQTTIDSNGAFIDEYKTVIPEVHSESEYELGPLYFTNSVMIRYISSDKQFKVVIAGIKKSEHITKFNQVDYIVSDISNIGSIYDNVKKKDDISGNSSIKFATSGTGYSTITNFNELYPTAYAYRYKLYSLIVDINELEKEHKELIEKYCTYSGYEEILKLNKYIDTLNIIELGTTDLNHELVNRVLIQYDDKGGNLKAALLKINSNGLIYDIDYLN